MQPSGNQGNLQLSKFEPGGEAQVGTHLSMQMPEPRARSSQRLDFQSPECQKRMEIKAWHCHPSDPVLQEQQCDLLLKNNSQTSRSLARPGSKAAARAPVGAGDVEESVECSPSTHEVPDLTPSPHKPDAVVHIYNLDT